MIPKIVIKYIYKIIIASALLSGCGNTTAPSVENVSKPIYDEAAEALYLERYNSRGKTQAEAMKAYDTLAPVTGTKSYEPLPKALKSTITKDALLSAKNYVTGKNTSAFMIWRNGALESENYFGKFDKESLIVSKSLAKPLATIAVGRAIKEGHIESLDQPVADYIIEWKNTKKDKILIRHLLDMRTGLLPQGQAIEPEHVLNRAYMHPHHDEIIIHEYPLVDEPGTRYEYANSATELVAPLIERATGKQYEDWVSEEILEPIGAKGGEIWMNRYGGTPHSGCCILLPAESYMRLAILFLQDGNWNAAKLLPDGYIEEARTATPQNPHTGMGVYVAGPYIEKRGPLNPDKPFGQTLHSEPYLAKDLFMFDGNGHQVAYIIPSANMVILRTGSWMPKGTIWDNSKLPNIVIKGIEFPKGDTPLPQK